MLCVELQMAAGELNRLHKLITGRFARSEPRARVRGYVSGLVAGLETQTEQLKLPIARDSKRDGEALMSRCPVTDANDSSP
jgi:hypothetical protein